MGKMYVDNTIQYCVDLIKTESNNLRKWGSHSSETYRKIEILVDIYTNCTIHPICTDLKNYMVRYKLNLQDVLSIFQKYIGTLITCPDIRSDKIKSMKKIRYKCNEMLFKYKKLTINEKYILNDLFIQEKICADHTEIKILYPSA